MESFVVYSSDTHRDLHVLTLSFPTRRASDLILKPIAECRGNARAQASRRIAKKPLIGSLTSVPSAIGPARVARRLIRARSLRSDEHTSELQSIMRISYAVFCLNKKN